MTYQQLTIWCRQNFKVSGYGLVYSIVQMQLHVPDELDVGWAALDSAHPFRTKVGAAKVSNGLVVPKSTRDAVRDIALIVPDGSKL